jgi:hypothetical protein
VARTDPDEKKYPMGTSDGVAFSPDGTEEAAKGGRYIRFLDPATARTLRTVPEPNTNTTTLEYWPNGRQLLTSDPGTTPAVMAIDSNTGKLLKIVEFGKNMLWSQAFSADGKYLCLAFADGTISRAVRHSIRQFSARIIVTCEPKPQLHSKQTGRVLSCQPLTR